MLAGLMIRINCGANYMIKKVILAITLIEFATICISYLVVTADAMRDLKTDIAGFLITKP